MGSRGSRYVPIELEELSPISGVYDLGSNGVLTVSPDYASQHHLLDGKRVSTVAGFGVEGIVVSQVAVLRSLSFGGVHLHSIPTEIPPS